ncbi:MAG TPA: DUF3426 domain-containing protein [Alphaproteobacteria bacterium]|nr:DUF3426 domain-containing protein [Alphaproteobacteria bacterium]
MILTCPTCAARYRVDPAKLGAQGRTVRCNACGHRWHARPTDAPLRLEPVPSRPTPRAAESLAAPRREPPTRVRSRWALAWFLVIVLVAGAAGAGYVERARVVEAWPPALRLYRLMGLMQPPAGEGLAVRNVTTRRSAVNGVELLTVQGEVVNLSDAPRAVPLLVATLTDSEHRDVQHWSFRLAAPKLLPGESATFVSHVENPAADAASLTVGFDGGAAPR